MGFKIKKPSLSGASIGSALGGIALGIPTAGVGAPIGAAIGGAIGSQAGDWIDDAQGALGIGDANGESGNQVVSTLTASQQQLMERYLGVLYNGVGNTVGNLQGYADKGYNPYDAVEGDRLTDAMRNRIIDDRNAQIDAIKGGNLNRFSMASAKAIGDAHKQAQNQITDLDYQNLMTKASMGQQAYGNQTNAIKDLFGLSSSLIGQQAFQNQQTYTPGWMDKLSQFGQGVGGIASGAKLFMG